MSGSPHQHRTGEQGVHAEHPFYCELDQKQAYADASGQHHLGRLCSGEEAPARNAHGKRQRHVRLDQAGLQHKGEHHPAGEGHAQDTPTRAFKFGQRRGNGVKCNEQCADAQQRANELHYQQAQIFYGTQHRYSPSLWPPVR